MCNSDIFEISFCSDPILLDMEHFNFLAYY